MADLPLVMTRAEVSGAWSHEEYEPVVEMLREAGLAGSGAETDAYMAVVSLRYLLLRTREWDERVLEALRQEMRSPSYEDTEIRRLRRALE